VAARVAEQVTIPFTFGGGIRSVADAYAVLEAGADKVSVNSAALGRPVLIEELAASLGSQAVVVAIDTEDGRVRSHAATRDAARDTVTWAQECEARGAGELLVTSIDRDGTRRGYDLDLLERLRDAVSLPVIASAARATPSTWRRRFASQMPHFSLRSCTSDRRASSLSAASSRDLGVPLRDAA